MGRGVACLQLVDDVPEEVDLAGDPEGAPVGEPELLLGQTEQALEEWVVEVVGLHLELAEDVVVLPDAHPHVAFREFSRRRPEALGSTAPHLLHNASHGYDGVLFWILLLPLCCISHGQEAQMLALGNTYRARRLRCERLE